MHRDSPTHLTDSALLSGLRTSLARERDALADVLAHLAEVEARKLHVPAGYGSMHDYCVHELNLSKDAANKRIHAARAALEFPAILERVAEGALGLRVVNLLVPFLRTENAEELLAAASFKTREDVQLLLAKRFPREAVPTSIAPIAQPQVLDGATPECPAGDQVVPGPLQGVVRPPEVAPLASDLYRLQLTMTGTMYAKLRRALELFGRRKPTPDEAEILELGLDLLVARLEKRRFAATDRPRAARRSESTRHVSNEVKREVWERDGGQCTFASEDGTRCPARMDLELDHIVPVARGGGSEASNVRLRCRPHNQYEAERAYGKAFMQTKREQAKAAAARRQAEKEAKRAAVEAIDNDVLMPGLRGLGFSKAEARFALSECGPMEGHGLQARLKRCLAILTPPHLKVSRSASPDSMSSPVTRCD